MKFNNAISQRLRRLGAEDAAAGKSIDAFYDTPGRHTEGMRAMYEIGYRAKAEEMRKDAIQKRFTEEGLGTAHSFEEAFGEDEKPN